MLPKFKLGRLVATPGALAALGSDVHCIEEFLVRHRSGDWGEALHPEDRKGNDQALMDGERLHSSYYLDDNQKLWVITEADRSATTVLLPSEY